MSIDTKNIRLLREKTGAGVADCMKALAESGGDLDAAAAIVERLGRESIEGKKDRAANEGRVAVAKAGVSRAALVAVGCETDFVARNEQFTAAANKLAQKILEHGPEVPAQEMEGTLYDIARRIQEKVSLKGTAYLEAGAGEYIDTYLHGEARIGVALRVRVDGASAMGSAPLTARIHDLCLQIAASSPAYIRREDIPSEEVAEKERAIMAEIEKDSKLRGKSDSLLSNVAAGKMRKFFSEACLYEQSFVRDEKVKVAHYISAIEKEAGTRISVTGFARLAIDAG